MTSDESYVDKANESEERAKDPNWSHDRSQKPGLPFTARRSLVVFTDGDSLLVSNETTMSQLEIVGACKTLLRNLGVV